MTIPRLNPKVMLVEGSDDYNLIRNLLFDSHKIIVDDYDYPNLENSPIFSIKKLNSNSKLRPELKLFVPKNELTHLAIVLDADTDVNAVYQRLQTAINTLATAEWPPLPPSGLITTVLRAGKPSLRLGLWVMPDNQQTGMLEHFASQLIPPADKLWPHAQQTVAMLPEKRFPTAPNDHTRKVELHTWLAWQKEPGRPMGAAVRAEYFQHNTLLAQTFVQWVQHMFSPVSQ